MWGEMGLRVEGRPQSRMALASQHTQVILTLPALCDDGSCRLAQEDNCRHQA